MRPHLFYNDRLINHPSVDNRPADTVWTFFISRFTPRCAGRYSISLSITPGSLYQPVGGSSKIDSAHTCIIRHVVVNLKMRGAQDPDIAIFTTYAAQLRLHRRMGMAEGVAKSTIDSAQVRE